MNSKQPALTHSEKKKRFTRDAILDSAERLIERGENRDFSMRQLATEAGMGVTTPFAHFGSKGGVLRGLIDRMIDRIEVSYRNDVTQEMGAVDRLFLMAQSGLDHLTSDPETAKLICGSLLVLSEDHPYAGLRRHTEYLWEISLDEGSTLICETAVDWRKLIPQQLAVSFRGALAMWIAEDLHIDQFKKLTINGVVTNLAGFVAESERPSLLERIVMD